MAEAPQVDETPQIDPADQFEVHPFYVFRWEESQEAHVLLYPEGVVKLNDTAAEILKLCDGDRSVTQIIDELKNVYDVSDPDTASRIEAGVYKFLEDSHAKGWTRRK
ncbi:MAG: pyrroloquinoline quinone biosynthesis peptide chaperone PqqD [Alphaproteobacteria bacterium]|nr:pyrroloquinoline quinone biosynthesis peptide chaperone PqqD [Alphaproteobacteria bacterium]